MKGRTNQPLVIWVAPQWVNHATIEALVLQGHRVVDMDQIHESDTMDPDLILHPAAHQWNDYLWDYLPAALAAARKRKREAK